VPVLEPDEFVASFLFGLVLAVRGITLTFSAVFHLFLCLAQMLHSLEEYFTKFWMHITEAGAFSKWRRSGDAGPIAGRAFFVLFNTALSAA
jgi:hypothetical protein